MYPHPPTQTLAYHKQAFVDGSCASFGGWDTAGAEDYDRLRPLSYPGTDVFLLFFSLHSKAALENCISKWAPEVEHHAPDVPIVLIGTKEDMRHDPAYYHAGLRERWVSYEEGLAVANQIGAAAYVEISSVDGYNARHCLATAVRVARVHEHFLPHPRKRYWSAQSADMRGTWQTDACLFFPLFSFIP